MIKLIIQLVLIAASVTYVCEMKIAFKPFSIAFPNWRAAVGIVVIVIGIGIYYNAAYRKGHRKAIDQVMEVIDGFKKNKR